ncbi:hypothetical protein HYZ80_00415 [Candidatus Parcubacteria bacterium]|nr:hypothetical protein [Candidatus Parcubacteria bacterium]
MWHSYTTKWETISARFAQRSKGAGFTVVELMIAMAVLFAVGMVVAAFVSSTVRTSGFFSRRAAALQDGRRTLEAFGREFREAAASSIGSYPIEAASASSFTFFADVDADSFRERIRYFLDGTTLKKGITKPSGTPLAYNPATESVQPVAAHVATTTSFAYFDGSYTGTQPPIVAPVDPVRVRYVVMTLVIDDNPDVPPDPVVLRLTATSRNLKSNL